MREKLSLSPFFPLQAALFEASLVVLAVLLGWIFNVPPLETMRVSGRSIVLGFVAVLPMLVLLVVCEFVTWRPIAEVRRVLDELLVPMFKNCTWDELAAIAILAGVGEELLFRGVFQAALVQGTGEFLPHSPAGAMAGDWIALVAVAIVFGLLHAVNVGYALLAVLMGLYLGWLWMVTGDLIVPVVAHAVYDFLALEFLLRRK